MVYNVVEAVIAISAGVTAGSVALVGFGLDSAIEVSSGLVILWQFSHALPEEREQRALRLMAICFFALAGFVGFESGRALLGVAGADLSPVGIALAAVSLVVMPVLSWAQRRTGRQLGSRAVVADGAQTLLCTYLSACCWLGLLLNATLGWSWADTLAGLVMAAVALREGLKAWRGESCCEPVPAGRESTEKPPAGRASASKCGLLFIAAGVIALGLYGAIATVQPDANFGRILAAYGGVFVAGSLLWGMVVDGFTPDRYDVAGALICLIGVAVIMVAPRRAA